MSMRDSRICSTLKNARMFASQEYTAYISVLINIISLVKESVASLLQ